MTKKPYSTWNVERRKILDCNVTQHPTTEWIVQQLREAFLEPRPYRHVILNYHHKDRLHDSLQKDTPNRRAVKHRPATNSAVISMPRLGGLHHRYTWREAA
jgi:hypothetical protein